MGVWSRPRARRAQANRGVVAAGRCASPGGRGEGDQAPEARQVAKTEVTALVLQAVMSQMSESTQRASSWMLTINNPTSDDEECIALARQVGWKVEGQLEKGKEGTPHYQLLVRTPQVRFSQVRKMFPRAHVEVTREPAAAAKYVHKEVGRISALPEPQAMYPSLSKFWHLIVERIDARNPYIIAAWQTAVEWDHEKAGYALPTPDGALQHAVERLIEVGYHVESIAVNPSTIAAWRRFHLSLAMRVYAERAAAEELAQRNFCASGKCPSAAAPAPPAALFARLALLVGA